MNQLALFNYDQLDTETRIVVQQRTGEIKALMRRTAQDIIEIGQKLIEVKERLGHGNFGNWLDAEFGWTERTAQRFMSVANTFKYDTVSDLPIQAKALYLLAAPSTPDEVRQEAIDRAGNGEQITYTKAKGLVSNHRDPNYQDKDKEYLGSLWSAEGSNGDILDSPNDNLAPNGKPHVSHNSGNNEWYTPLEYIEAAHRVMGAIDLDPASCADANIVVKATQYYSQNNDGLAQNWRGRVWMNPPYAADLIDKFCLKLVRHIRSNDITEAIVLVNNATETGWFRELVSVASAVTFPASRVKFWKQDGSTGAPLQGQAVLYIGSNASKFLDTFGGFGWGAVIR